jgi:hypothetical protein
MRKCVNNHNKYKETRHYYLAMTETTYDFSSPTMDYNDGFEYRACLRKLFNMKDVVIEDDPDLDDVTRDEMNFDEEATRLGYAQIYELLKDKLLFYDLFIKAASFMISEDPEVGLCILMSYDYLKPFYPVLVKHATVDIKDADYKTLYSILYS